MKKRIFILTLTFVFLVSTTGLPVSYHLCKMMEQKSLSECEICKAEMKKSEMSCCTEEMDINEVKLISENPICCQIQFVYNKVEDEFVSNKTEINFYSSDEILIQPIVLIPHAIEFALEESFNCDSSPPFLINPELHITNSVLLI
jgi:hypothetical protein